MKTSDRNPFFLCVIGPWNNICLRMTTQQQKQQGYKFLSGVETEQSSIRVAESACSP